MSFLLQSELANRLCESDLMFLEMYKKGRQSAVFERETEVIIIIMVIFKCYFSGELIALT